MSSIEPDFPETPYPLDEEAYLFCLTDGDFTGSLDDEPAGVLALYPTDEEAHEAAMAYFDDDGAR